MSIRTNGKAVLLASGRFDPAADLGHAHLPATAHSCIFTWSTVGGWNHERQSDEETQKEVMKVLAASYECFRLLEDIGLPKSARLD